MEIERIIPILEDEECAALLMRADSTACVALPEMDYLPNCYILLLAVARRLTEDEEFAQEMMDWYAEKLTEENNGQPYSH